MSNIVVTKPFNNNTLSKKLHKQIYDKTLKIEDILFKFQPRNIRTKRGLFDALGTTFKWIAGTPDANDLHNLNQNINALIKGGTGTINKINYISATLQSLTTKLSENQKIVQKEILELQDHLTKLDTINNYNFLLELLYHQTNSMLQMLQLIERNIAFAWRDIVNLEMFTANEIQNIYSYLVENYRLDQIISIDHPYSILEISTAKIAQAKDLLIFLVKIPILSLSNGTLYQIYPIPNKHKILVVPPTPFYISMNDHLHGWLPSLCPSIANMSICKREFQITNCNLENVSTCTTSFVKNQWSSIFKLPHQELLLDTSTSIDVIEDCNGQISKTRLKGTYAIFSSCRVIINEILYDQVRKYMTKRIETPELLISSENTVNFSAHHLVNYEQLRTDLTEVLETPVLLHSITQTTHFVITFVLITFISVLIIITYRHRTKLTLIAKRKVIKIPMDQLPLEEIQKDLS